MQKIILDTIEKLNKNYIEYTDAGVMVYFTGKNDGECGVDLDDFLKQALTKAYEAGQKSREKEIVEKVKMITNRAEELADNLEMAYGIRKAEKDLEDDKEFEIAEEAHRTAEGWCCACSFDMAVLEDKILAQKEKIIKMVESKKIDFKSINKWRGIAFVGSQEYREAEFCNNKLDELIKELKKL